MTPRLHTEYRRNYTDKMARRRTSIDDCVKELTATHSGLLVAVSGGIDSMVLLRAVHRAFTGQSGAVSRCEVLHVDHGLRPESASDASFVSQAAERYGFGYHVVRLPARPTRSNTEAWARTLRYRVAEGIRAERNLSRVVTAHHGNDLVETLFLQLLQNRPLSGIAADCTNRHLARPLFTIPRSEIVTYAADNSVEYVVDATNKDTTLLRNWIRHELMPLLVERLGEGVLHNFIERSISLSEDLEALRAQARTHTAVLARNSARIVTGTDVAPSTTIALSRRAIYDLDATQSRSIAWRAIEEFLLPIVGYRLGFHRATAVIRAINAGTAALELPGRVRIQKTQEL